MKEKEERYVCCICGKEFTGMGNNPEPVVTKRGARCCDTCNAEKVIPARLEAIMGKKNG